MTDEIRRVREALHAADEGLYASHNRLRAKQAQLVQARRLGGQGEQEAQVLEREIAALKHTIQRARAELESTRSKLSDLVGTLVLPQSPQQLASQLDDSLPSLLFPVRVETRFLGAPGRRELWVRVYPDDIALHTHEKALTRDEADSGVGYWTERALAASLNDPAETERREKGAWRALANSYGGSRASWIVAEIRRRAVDREGSEDLAFLLMGVSIADILAAPEASADKREAIEALLDSPHPLAGAIRPPIQELLAADQQIADATRQAILQTVSDGILVFIGFDLEELKAESWTRSPRSEAMPDRFVLIGLSGSARLEQPFPHAIPNPLIVGPNPQNLEAELAQQGDDILVGEDFAWITDFDKAVEVGMAMRLPLDEPFASAGFDRLMVLGLRVTSDAAEHRKLLEDLIDAHHYSPGGMGFLRQGTPTNHTGDLRSGFSSDDAEGEASFETETIAPDIEAVEEDLHKTDAQRFAEAWDVDLAKVAVLANAGCTDVAQAKLMNRALWPATLGYFLDELLEVAPEAIGDIRSFFAEQVVARGSVPVIRVGTQPYGILVTSAFAKWQVNDKVDGDSAPFLRQAHQVLTKVEGQWQQLVGQVAHVDGSGDPFANLLNILGLQSTSVDFQRRIGTYKTMLWNLAHFRIGFNAPSSDPVVRYFQEIASRGIRLLSDLGLSFPQLPRLFGLLFGENTSVINGPLIDDVRSADVEKLSETAGLPLKYAVKVTESDEDVTEDKNYVGWLINSGTSVLKQQQFVDRNGETLPIPAALLYRMLHRSLLLSVYDATMNLYEDLELVDKAIRREQDFTNVEAGRTVTRWEFMEGTVGRVMPQVSTADMAIGDFLSTDQGLNLPAAFTFREVRDSIAGLEMLKTAELERLFAEHIDLCSYRLDAWQTAFFAQRLERLNRMRQGAVDGGTARQGVHLGAYGWLENVRPAPPSAPVPTEDIPPDLREDGVDVVEQPGNGGYIHGPSINHAVAAAVLRNAYLTHADQDNATHFSVNLTSDRVRTAFAFLEGVRNGQELGALLGYQFERALHDRHVIDGKALEQFVLAFRTKYPLVADKITPDASNGPIQHKEAAQVVDGYALLQAILLADPPLAYPFGVEGLPTDPNDGARQAIIAEVKRLEGTLDAIADLALSEGVFQVTQGNYERAGAMLKAISEGNAPPEPEIASTPRSGAVVHHKIAVQFETDADPNPWGGAPTPKSLAAPGLNQWLGDRIGTPASIAFSIAYALDNSITEVSLSELALQPIDLIYLIGDQAGAVEGSQSVSDLTELEARIDFAFRVKRMAGDPQFDPSGLAAIRFISREGFSSPELQTLFELLPLLRNLRTLVTTSRPLGADDYQLPSEQTTDPGAGENPKRWAIGLMKQGLDEAALSLKLALDELQVLIASIPASALSKDPVEAGDLSTIDYDALRGALVKLSYFGLPDAFPKNAAFAQLGPEASDAEVLALLRARQALIGQAFSTHELGRARHRQAKSLSEFDQLSEDEIDRLSVQQKVDIFQQAGALILGDAFRFVPVFTLSNLNEMQAAHAFSAEAPAEQSLLRFTQERLKSTAVGSAIEDWRALAIDEWLHGVAAVREKARQVDLVKTYQEALAGDLALQPLQLPFDDKAHWIAMEFPRVPREGLDDPDRFAPSGDFLSVVRQLPVNYSVEAEQSGLLIDEWSETIPNRLETTGIAMHYNQPSTEPPQCVLIAVSPTFTGRWDWDDLVDTLVDTFDRAKRRAVEPDFLRATPYAQLLPAVLSSFTSYPFGTISTNMSAQPASMELDQG